MVLLLCQKIHFCVRTFDFCVSYEGIHALQILVFVISPISCNEGVLYPETYLMVSLKA